MLTQKVKIPLSVSIVVALAGCANIEDKQKFSGTDAVGKSVSSFSKYQQRQLVPDNIVTDIDGLYLGEGRRGPLNRRQMLPPSVDQTISLFDSRALSLRGIAERLEDATGLNVKVLVSSSKIGMPAGDEDVSMGFGMSAQATSPDEMLLQVLEAGDLAPDNSMRLQFDGHLSDFLDRIAARFDVSWEYRGGQILISHMTSRTYQLAMLSGKYSNEIIMSNSTGEGGGGSGEEADYTNSSGSLNVEFDSESDPWGQVNEMLGEILGDRGVYSMNPSTSTVIVAATPSGHEGITEYIDSYNEILNRQVAINVSVFTLQLEDDSSYGFNLDAAYQSMSRNYGLNISGPNLGTNLGGEFSASLFESADSRFGGSELLMQALSEFGETSIVTSATGVVLNGQPFPIQDVNRTTYLAETEISQVADAGSSVSLTPGTVTTGFSMQVVPQILSNDQLLLQYGFSLSNLKDLRQLSSGNQTIQGPDVDERSFAQRSRMPIGGTLVIAGFQRDEDSNTSRVGATGASRRNSKAKTMVFVTITANRM
jgi:type IVB pilus formation R64 PilN family outer membrane protein